MSDPGTSGAGYPGWRGVSSDTSRYNATWFMVQQLLGTVRTATLVQVQSCTNDGGLSPVGFVDVVPMVALVNGLFQTSQHGVIHGLPYFRVQGGTNAIICDPAERDIGIAVFADRDISSVKANKAPSAPGSRRRFDWADGLYFGGVLGASPTKYLRFTNTGIDMADSNGNSIVMSSSGISINGVNFDRSQNITNAADITTQSGIDLGGHKHGGVTAGSGTSGGPTG